MTQTRDTAIDITLANAGSPADIQATAVTVEALVSDLARSAAAGSGGIGLEPPSGGSRKNLFDLDRVSLENFFEEKLGEKRFRAHQVMKWIHHRYVTDFNDMTDLGKSLRAKA
jgi:23S rRNA (adenine2503-C2)-methyltransferase